MNSATRIFFSNALAKIKSRAVHRVYSESERISLKWTDLKCIWLICRISKTTAYLPCLLWPSFWSSFSGKQLWLDHIIKWLKLVSYQHGSDSVKLGWLNIRISQKLQPRSKSSRTNMQLSLLKMNLNKSKESRYIKMTSRWNEIWMFSVQCQLPLVSSPAAPQTVTSLHESSPRRHMWWQLDRVWPGNVTKIDDVEKEEIWNIWRPLPAVAVTHLLCIRTTYIHLPTITCWFERSCGFPLQPSADSSSWLLTFTSSKSVHVRPMSVPSSPSLLSVFAGLRFLSGGIEFCLAGSCSCMIHDASSAIMCQNKGHHGHPWRNHSCLALISRPTPLLLLLKHACPTPNQSKPSLPSESKLPLSTHFDLK